MENMYNNILHADQLLTTEQLVPLTGMTRRFWETRRMAGDGPTYIRLGYKAIRYRWGDVKDWLNQHTFTSTTQKGQLS